MNFHNSGKIMCFHDILEKLNDIENQINQHAIVPNLRKLECIVSLHFSTISTCERSFRLNNPIKTDIRWKMTDSRMNHLSTLSHYNDITDNVYIADIVEEFININESRVRMFSISLFKD